MSEEISTSVVADTDILTIELNNLAAKCNERNWYAAIFAVKDSYEILVKYSCLTVASLAFDQDSSDDIFKIFTDPERSMSFGDWTNDVIRCVRDYDFVKSDSTLSSFFKKLVDLINSTSIVTWRNDTIGHGVMKFSADPEMIQDITEKKDTILSFAADQSAVLQLLASCTDEFHRAERSPFIVWNGSSILLFESMARDGSVRYLNVTERSRVRWNDSQQKVSLWKEKRQKFYGSLNVTSKVIPSELGYDAELDSILAAFNKTSVYQKPLYLADKVKIWLKTYESGTFLIYADRGTGKSSFVYACDELQQDKGDQKVKLSYDNVKVTVRAYYANRTEMLTPDEAERHIFELLEIGPNDRQIRIRGISQKQLLQLPFTSRVEQYFNRYKEAGTDKLVIFIDGLDEMNDNNTDILKCIPDADTVPKGIYFICMCRSKDEGIPARVSSYCESIHFTEVKAFDRNSENAELLKSFLKSKLHYNDKVAGSLAQKLDFRFSTVPLLAVLEPSDVEALLGVRGEASGTEPEDRGSDNSVSHVGISHDAVAHNGASYNGVLDARQILSKYLEKLNLRYGDAYFKRMLRIAVILAETPGEALEMQEVSWLAEGHVLSTREIAFFYDLRPLLMEFRDYRGAVYGMSSVTWVEALRDLYPAILKELVLEWEQDLLSLDTHQESAYPQQEWYANLYKASVLAIYMGRYQLKPTDYKLMKRITYVATRYKEGGQQHITYRSMRCFHALFHTYYDQLSKAFEEEAMLCFLAVFNTCVSQYADLNIEKQLQGMVKDVETLLKKYERECEDNDKISFQILAYYSNMICVCGDLYDLDKGDAYFRRAEHLYKKITEKWPNQKSEYEFLWRSMYHNAVSMTRYRNPAKAVQMVPPMLAEMRRWAKGYSDINTGCAVAMCYLSNNDGISAYRILKECNDHLNQMPFPRNPYENEIYIVTRWRYCQLVHEAFGLVDVTIGDVEAAGVMDQILNYLVSVEQQGFSDLIRWIPQMAMTAALIQGKLAEIKSKNPYGTQSEIENHLRYAVAAAEKVPQIYDEWDRLGIPYDRTSAMHNFVNVGAIYAEAFQAQKGIEIIQAGIEKYEPQNEMERIVHKLMKSKIDEIRAYCIDGDE